MNFQKDLNYILYKKPDVLYPTHFIVNLPIDDIYNKIVNILSNLKSYIYCNGNFNLSTNKYGYWIITNKFNIYKLYIYQDNNDFIIEIFNIHSSYDSLELFNLIKSHFI